MAIQTLHITNGNDLTDYLKELEYTGGFLTWQEMLCEGPTVEQVDSQNFLNLRKTFLSEFYEVEMNEEEFKKELDVLNNTDQFQEIVLWFEYDLFCHINMMAIISMLNQKKIQLPLYLVCSGRVKGENDLKGLVELKPDQLHHHYKNKITLTEEDRNLMSALWRIYCGTDHNLFKPYIVQKSSFPYLASCLKAHLQRFPDSLTGLSTLEMHTLHIISDQKIKSRRHLLGYILNFQGYYGFGDLQINKMIETLSIFFTEDDDYIILNEKGHEANNKQRNFLDELMTSMYFGGVKKMDFQFSKVQNKLIKTISCL